MTHGKEIPTADISVIVASTRHQRFVRLPARWIPRILRRRFDVDAPLLDARDFPAPSRAAPATPAMPGWPPFKNESIRRWTAARNGFVVVSPENVHGHPAILKNALD